MCTCTIEQKRWIKEYKNIPAEQKFVISEIETISSPAVCIWYHRLLVIFKITFYYLNSHLSIISLEECLAISIHLVYRRYDLSTPEAREDLPGDCPW